MGQQVQRRKKHQDLAPRGDAGAVFERLLDRLAPGMLLLADRGFPSYDVYTVAVQTGAELLWRVSASFALPVKWRLVGGSWHPQRPPAEPVLDRLPGQGVSMKFRHLAARG